jgi:FlaA1/EpsC-like NDP-sugar epimerase
MASRVISNLARLVLSIPRSAKRLIVVLMDMSFCVLCVWLAYYLRLGEFISITGNDRWGWGALCAALVSIALAIPLFVVNGLYRAIFRYSGWPALLAVARAVGIYGLVYAFIFTVIGFSGVPRTVGIIQPLILLIIVGMSRAFARFWLGDHYLNILKKISRPKALIYGAGPAGRQLAAAMASNHEMQIIGFLDDDRDLHGRLLNGLPVYDPAQLIKLTANLSVSHVLLAMPSLSRGRRNEILGQIRSARVVVRTLPSITDFLHGNISVADLRELDVDDLLGRETVVPDSQLLSLNVKDKTVLVTGAGGSIGSELCRQILELFPATILLIEQNEFALYSIHQELQARQNTLSSHTSSITTIVPLLASVQDEQRLDEIMSTWCPQTIYHAAAYKHVPLVEHNPAVGIYNNVFGTLIAARLALKNRVADFVLISTDKAVRPTNVMGASKRLAEMALQALADRSSSTKFSMVRFGNVLGSSGSVVPKFRMQIREGGPITITHPDITRYFMTIPEAAQLVIQAGTMSNGGDVFVLDMGQPVRILDLARRMVELSGYTVRDIDNPAGDISIEVTGLRPGEKLFEELLIGDCAGPTSHPRIMRAQESFISWDELEKNLNRLETALRANLSEDVRLILQQLVQGYHPNGEIVDWVFLKRGHLN